MTRAWIVAALAVTALSSGWAQSAPPLPCKYDWSQVNFVKIMGAWTEDLRRIGRCADSAKVPWDTAILNLQKALQISAQPVPGGGSRPSSNDPEIRALEEQLRLDAQEWIKMRSALQEAHRFAIEERDRVKNARTQPPRELPARGADGARGAGENARPARDAVSTGRATVMTPLGERPVWIPPSKKRLPRVARRIGTATADGPGTIMRGTQTIRFVPGQPIDFGNGDIIRTEAGGQVILDMDGATLRLSGNSSFQAGDPDDEPSGSPGTLLRGVLEWASKVKSKALKRRYQVRTPTVVIGVRGTTFKVRQQNDVDAVATTIVLTEGEIDSIDAAGNIVAMKAGDTRTFRQPVSPLSPGDPIVRAFNDDRPVREGDRLLMPAGIAGVWMPRVGWQVMPDDESQPMMRSFQSDDGAVAGRLMSALWPLTREDLRQVAWENLRLAAPSARIAAEQWRVVRGLNVLRIDAMFASGGIEYVFRGAYFTGAAGTAQLTVLAPQASARAHSAAIDAVLDSLIVANPLRFPPATQR